MAKGQNRSKSSNVRSNRNRSIGKRVKPNVTWEIPWNRANLFGFAFGIAVIVIGFVVMASAISDDPAIDKSAWNNSASTTIAPILLTLAYCVIIPVAIFWRKKEVESESAVEVESSSE